MVMQALTLAIGYNQAVRARARVCVCVCVCVCVSVCARMVVWGGCVSVTLHVSVRLCVSIFA